MATRLEIDHRCPLADGGTDTDGNIDIRCVPCHQAKTTLENRNRSRTT